MITLLKQNVTPYPFIRTIMWDYFLKRLSYTLFMRRHFEMKIVLMRIVAICRRLFLHQLYFFEEILSWNNSNNLETFSQDYYHSSCWHLNSINYSDNGMYIIHQPDNIFWILSRHLQTMGLILLHNLHSFAIWFITFLFELRLLLRRLNHERLYTPHSCRKWQDQNDNFQILGGGPLQLQFKKLWLTLRYGVCVIYGSNDLPLFRFKSAW